LIQGQIIDKHLSQPQNADVLVIVIKPPTLLNQEQVVVVEMAFGMDYLSESKEQKAPAKDFFPENTRLFSESCYCEK
jgi:hypothetical protein